MTTPEPKEYEVPAGAMRPGELGKLQNINGQSINWGQLTGITAAAEGARRGFLQGLNKSIIGPLTKAFTGSEGDLPELTTAITDQQSKTQELWDERGRAAVFSSANLEYRGDQSAQARLRIPFTEQVGPMIGVEVEPTGGLVLKTPGAWIITAKVGVSGTRAVGANWQRMWIEVRDHAGALIGESWATSFAGTEQATMQDTMPVVISPEQAAAGAEIAVFQDAGRHRYLLGGHGYTMLFAQKMSSSIEMSTVDPGAPGEYKEIEE